MPRPPVAFMSYVRFDDQHENGRLTTFRERLSAEVRMQTGEEFPIFQDRNDIKWGQNWKERLEGGLDEVTFLIPIITPGFFKSSFCREELQRFLEREKQLDRNDLVLPVYYVRTPALDDAAKRAADELAQAIAAHQYADWRDLRFEPFTTPLVGKTLAQMATQIAEALERVQESPKTNTPPSSPKLVVSPSATEAIEVSSKSSGPSPKTEPPTRVVDPMHRGNHVTITEAINAANPGDRILVRPGFYQEGLVIDKPLEIIGDGQREEIVIQAKGKHVILFKAMMGRVANLTLRQVGGEGRWYGVDVAQGRLDLEDCDITSQSSVCIGIHDGADPRLRRNRIHDGKGGGLAIYDNGQGTLEENDILGNVLAGIHITIGSNPTLRRNRIHDNRQSGVIIYDNGRGVLEENEIFGNTYSGVGIKTGGNPTLCRNRIHDNRESGVYIPENGQGILEDNDIYGNAYAGINVKTGSNPTVRHNRINKNGYQAIWIWEGGTGTFEDNDLRDNAKGAWDISKDRLPNVKRARNIEE
jgi:parallel beta-helix repeat protein